MPFELLSKLIRIQNILLFFKSLQSSGGIDIQSSRHLDATDRSIYTTIFEYRKDDVFPGVRKASSETLILWRFSLLRFEA